MTDLPRATRYAVLLMFVGCALSLLSAVAAWLSEDHVRAEITRLHSLPGAERMTSAQIAQTASTSVTVLVATALVAAVVWAGMAWVNRQGLWWGRITAIVLTLLCALQSWSFLTRSHPTALTGTLNLLTLAVAIACTALLWRKENSAHFGQSVPDQMDVAD
ncbi:hypothetical protein [Calidifontibacter terrae]